ncbi:hypothetical protein DFJ58DRAFT_778373 [Suillus subalutaceus]|uniref:uncharacterized protein n=1 Tax=Suillus subalutaceus TaxID=48586 RepID=UPI001B86D19C|nr:uncharacterized protein DFJ58DRAFT_778373 [Suillus subalutaceus]KAG1860650.1 hypothetical protein DFJ58DRAFT_778373 [Suillus subalutaceus]
MGYFSSFLICHMYFRHRFVSSGSVVLDQLFPNTAWCAIVAYSRFVLLYHTPHQVKWGLGIGMVLGVSHYVCTELLPTKFPDSVFGRIRSAIVNHPVSVWLRLRDGWGVWEDGGREAEWKQWRIEWLKQHAHLAGKKTT